jgi:hypothetical protein
MRELFLLSFQLAPHDPPLDEGDPSLLAQVDIHVEGEETVASSPRALASGAIHDPPENRRQAGEHDQSQNGGDEIACPIPRPFHKLTGRSNHSLESLFPADRAG